MKAPNIFFQWILLMETWIELSVLGEGISLFPTDIELGEDVVSVTGVPVPVTLTA